MSASTEPVPGTDRRPRQRDVAIAVVVLAPLWALAISQRDRFPVLWIAVTAGVVLGLAATILMARHRVTLRAGHDVWLALPAAALHLAVSYVAIPVATALVPLIGEQAEGLVFDARGGLPTAAVAAIAAVVVAPLEEVFWRGAVQPLVGTGRAPIATVVLTSLVFVAYHVPTLQLPLISAAALGGLVWGWLRERTDGVSAPIVAHAIWTAAMVVVPPT